MLGPFHSAELSEVHELISLALALMYIEGVHPCPLLHLHQPLHCFYGMRYVLWMGEGGWMTGSSPLTERVALRESNARSLVNSRIDRREGGHQDPIRTLIYFSVKPLTANLLWRGPSITTWEISRYMNGDIFQWRQVMWLNLYPRKIFLTKLLLCLMLMAL